APGAGAPARNVSGTGRVQLPLDGPRSALEPFLRALAAGPAVEWVEPVGRPQALSTDASWILQTGRQGAAPGTRRLFETAPAIGLTGVGQRVALADVGVDHDACQFRFAGGPATVF